MSWLASLGVALLSGGLALVLAGWVANACVGWFNISSFEGKSGYFVVATALLGGLVGLVLGIVVARTGAGVPPGFLRALGLSWGIVAGLAGLAALVCRGLADVPPQLDGQELAVEVELRLPADRTKPPASYAGTSRLALGSVVDRRRRAVQEGTLDLAHARQVDGRWIIPGSVFLFTTRGKRVLELELDGAPVMGFLLPLPTRPTHAEEAWSEWLPRLGPGGQPWPASEVSYRCRVQPVPEPPPPPDLAAEEAARFAALGADAPLAAWLEFVGVDAPPERAAAIRAVAEARPAELAGLIGSQDAEQRERALEVLADLATVAPALVEPVLGEGRAIEQALAHFNTLGADDPRFHDVQIELRSRFNTWKRAWWNVQQRLGLDGRPPVQAIHDLAQVRAQGTSMDEIVVNARVILEALDPPAAGPR